MVKAICWYIMKFHEGEAKESDFKVVEEDLPPLNVGEIQVEALYFSVDPYIRVYVRLYKHPLGTTMFAGQVARVIETRHPRYRVGDLVYGYFGWRTHTNVDVGISENADYPSYKLPDFKGLSPSYGLGALGMPGITAYFGLLEVCEPKAGETIVVNSAAGAVGSLVGQIARIKGCRAIGIAGSAAKCKFLKDQLGFDHAINYKTDDVLRKLQEAAPNGVDCYFDNVGGVLSSIVIGQMNEHGRVAICGAASVYNDDVTWPLQVKTAPIIQSYIVFKELKLLGFKVTRWNDRYPEGIHQLQKWISEGKIKTFETVTEGFENTIKAFIGMMNGENIGKAIVKVK